MIVIKEVVDMSKDKIVVEEQIIEVCESRIKNTIKEYKKGIPFTGIVSASFASAVSFVVAFASFSNTNSYWKWIFLVLFIISGIIFIVFGAWSINRIKTMKGTEKWFLNELKGLPHEGNNKTLTDKGKKRLFNTFNILIIIAVLASIFLIALGINNWKIEKIDVAFWAIYCILGFAYILGGTFINAFLASIFFGYDHGYPGD